jgi:hypothetical protein
MKEIMAKKLKQEPSTFFMETPSDGESVVEALLSLWNIDSNG